MTNNGFEWDFNTFVIDRSRFNPDFRNYILGCAKGYQPGKSTVESSGDTTWLLESLVEISRNMPIYEEGVEPIDDEVLRISEESDRILDQQYRNSLQSLIRRSIEAFRESTAVYYSDVIQCINEESASDLCERIRKFAQRSYRGRLCLISLHDCHVHLVHECSYSNKMCRCLFNKETKIQPDVIFRRPIRRGRRPGIATLKETDWENIYIYFNSQGRKITWLILQGSVEEIQSYDKDLEDRRYRRYSIQPTMGTCASGDDPELRGEQCIPQNSDKIGTRSEHSTSPKTKRRRGNNKHTEILSFIEENPCCPVINCVDHPKYLNNDELCQYRGDSQLVKNAVDVFSKRVMSWTLYDFHKFFNKPNCNPIFM